MKRFKKLVILFSLLLGGQTLSAQNQYRVQVDGNDKTSSEHVQFLVNRCLEQQDNTIGQVIIPELKKCLMNEKLFSDVDIQVDADTITVDIEDRWSLIPIPMISQSEGESTRYGFFLMETNFLGQGKMLIGGWLGSSDGSQTFLMYRDPEFLGTRWDFSVNYSNSDKELFLYDKEDKIDGQKYKQRSEYLKVGYNLTKYFNIGVSYAQSSTRYEAIDRYQKLEDLNAQYVGLVMDWNDSDFKFYFQEGLQMNYEIQKQFYRNDDESSVISQLLEVDWQKNAFSDMVFQLKFRLGQLNGGDQRDLLQVGGGPTFRGIQSNGAWVKQYRSASVDYQIPVKTIDEGTWTIAPFVDVGYLNYASSQLDDTTYFSTGIGTYFFMKKVSFPGVGITYGYNNKFQDSFYNITIGFSM